MKSKHRYIICLIIAVILFALSLVWLYSTIKQNNPTDTNVAVISVDKLASQKSSVIFKWQCDNAILSSYQIFRCDANNPEFTYCNSAPIYEKYYTDNEVSNGKTYGYRVRAFNSRKETNKFSALSDAVYIHYDKSKDTNLNLAEFTPTLTAQRNDDKIKLSWEPIPNVPVTSVCIYYKNTDNKWEVAKVVSPLVTTYEETIRSNEYKIIIRNSLEEETIRSQEGIVSLSTEVQNNE